MIVKLVNAIYRYCRASYNVPLCCNASQHTTTNFYTNFFTENQFGFNFVDVCPYGVKRHEQNKRRTYGKYTKLKVSKTKAFGSNSPRDINMRKKKITPEYANV